MGVPRVARVGLGLSSASTSWEFRVQQLEDAVANMVGHGRLGSLSCKYIF